MKLIFVALNIFISLKASLSTVIILFVLNSILLCLSPEIILSFFKVIMRLSLFWICYLLCSLLLSIPFEQQISFLVRVVFVIQISVFFRQSLNLEYFLFDTASLHKYGFFTDICYFFLYTDFLVKYLYVNITNIEYDDSLSSKFSVNYIEYMIRSIKIVLAESVSMKDKMPVLDFDTVKTLHRPFWTMANVFCVLCFVIWLALYIISRAL